MQPKGRGPLHRAHLPARPPSLQGVADHPHLKRQGRQKEEGQRKKQDEKKSPKSKERDFNTLAT